MQLAYIFDSSGSKMTKFIQDFRRIKKIQNFLPTIGESIRKAISEYKIRLKSLNVLLRRSCLFVFFVAHVICALNVLKKTIVSTAQNKIKRSFCVPFFFPESLS